MDNVAHVTEIDDKALARAIGVLLARIRALRTLVREDGDDESQFAPNLPTLRQGLNELECLASELCAAIQMARGELVLADLPNTSLSEALTRLVETTAEAHALSSRSVFSGQEQLLSEQQTRLLYRLAQESCMRVAMHEGAHRLRFSLDYQPTAVVMSIEDDGVPGDIELLFEQMPGEMLTIPPFLVDEQIAHTSLLANTLIHRLQSMIEHLGGAFTIHSGLEQGTRIQACLPYAVPEHREERLILAYVEPVLEPLTKISVLIVDNQAVSRAGLHRLLESYPDLEVIGEAADSMQAVSETAELLPQVVLIDAQLPVEQSLETVRQLRRLNTTIRVLFLADREREEFLSEALRAGASGYILKDRAPDELAHAVRQVARGEVLVQPHLAARLLARLSDHGHMLQEKLTARERDVLQLLARGLRNKEIAARLTVSERTINFHLANIYAKLHVSGRTEALSKALERGLLKV
ncbi:MAG: LuxR C-terminal-related transcriptional regulator [Ktedonobacteraceae bacterium]